MHMTPGVCGACNMQHGAHHPWSRAQVYVYDWDDGSLALQFEVRRGRRGPLAVAVNARTHARDRTRVRGVDVMAGLGSARLIERRGGDSLLRILVLAEGRGGVTPQITPPALTGDG